MIKNTKWLRNTLFLALILLNIGCDQLSKSLVRQHMDYHDQISFVDEHVTLTKVENSGAFLSMGDEWSPEVKSLFLHVFPALMMLGLIVWLFRFRMHWGMALGICCIIGGGIGNIFDRLMYGSVTDFLYIHYGYLRTGIFNCADMSITFGALIIIALGIFRKH